MSAGWFEGRETTIRIGRESWVVFDKVLSSLGIGAARVDTRLEKKQVQPGEQIRGEVFVRGGETDQRVDDIYLYLIVHFDKAGKIVPYVMKKVHLCESFVIPAREYRIFPFELFLPYELPMSTGRFPVLLKTGLNIPLAKDPTDLDRIEVFPHPTVSRMLREIEKADFLLEKVDSVYDRTVRPHPFVQRFTFRPIGRYHGVVDELDVVFHVSAENVRMEVEVFRGNRSLTSTFAWSMRNPDGTLLVNDRSLDEVLRDPIETIRSVLQRPGTMGT